MNRRWIGFVGGLIVACSAAEEPKVSMELVVDVRDSQRAPVEGVGVTVDGRDVTTTDGDGVAIVRLVGREGEPLRVGVRCPDGAALADDEAEGRAVVLRRLVPLDDRSWSPARETFVCAPLESASVVLLRIDGGSDLDVRVRGEVIGRTDGDGIAHVVLKGFPGEEVDVVVDTGTAPRLRPSHPSRRVVLPEVGQILVFDERLEEVRPRRSRRRARAARRPKRL